MEKALIRKYLSEKTSKDYRELSKIEVIYQNYLNGTIEINGQDFEIWKKELMEQNLIKRYLLVKAYEQGKISKENPYEELFIQEQLYQSVISGDTEIDQKDFDLWLNNLRRCKTSFGEYLNELHCFKNSGKIVEITESNMTSTGSLIIPNVREYIITNAGNGCFSRPSSAYSNEHLLINGIYDNEMIYLMRACKDGMFSIGYCGDKDSEYTKNVLKYYKNLRKFLSKIVEKEDIKVIDDTISGSDKIYVLNYKTGIK